MAKKPEQEYRPQAEMLGEEELEALSEFRTSKAFKVLKLFMEVKLADYKDASFVAQDEHIEQTTVNGNVRQTTHIKKSAMLQRENLLGRKIGFDELLSYISECGKKYDDLHEKKPKKRKS